MVFDGWYQKRYMGLSYIIFYTPCCSAWFTMIDGGGFYDKEHRNIIIFLMQDSYPCQLSIPISNTEIRFVWNWLFDRKQKSHYEWYTK